LMHLDDLRKLSSFELVKRDLIDASTISEESEKKSAKMIVRRLEHLVFNWNVRAGIPLNRIVFVVEDFILREGSHSSERSGLSSPRIVSLVEGEVGVKFPAIEMPRQSPSNAKTVATDARLRSNGLWRPGRPHENDAVRHLVLWVRRNS
jgi:hypothetical protein